MTTRRSKIGRLPFDIREDLNNRLLENVPTEEILIWLRTDSTVVAVLRQLFQGRYITEQDLSEWRQGGYQEWLTYRSCVENVRDLSEDAARIGVTGINAEHFLLALTATFADLLKKWGRMDEIAFNRKLIVLQHLTKLALSIRKSEQRDARLRLDRERLEILREKHRDKSPSSCSSQSTSFSSARPSGVYPSIATNPDHHPQAAQIRRPPPPPDPNLYPDDPDWPPIVQEFYRSGPSPDNPPEAEDVVAVPAAPSPGAAEAGNPIPKTPNRLD